MAVRPSLNHKPASKPVALSPVALATAVPSGEATRRPRSAAEGYRPPSRQGKRAAVAWLEPEAIKQLNMYAIQHDRNVQDILVEAINDWFVKEGLPRFDAEN
jgi:antitoxin-like ribbon-helix-helix protein